MMMRNGKQYRVVSTKQFRRDVRKIRKSGRYDIRELQEVVTLLVQGKHLPSSYKNHKLLGKYKGFEECHVRPDWLLVYKREHDHLILTLTRTGSHAQIFGE